MRILLVDDHEVVRRGLRQMLAEEFADLVCGEAATAGEALERLREAEWNLVILDIAMPGRNGLDLLADLHERWPGLRVLVLSMSPEEEFAVRALKRGAAGYLAKHSVARELIAAVRKVLTGGRYITPAVAEYLANKFELGGAEEPHRQLSDREMQVLCLIACGRGIKEIAAELALSEKTVFTYRERLRLKLGLHNDVEMARYALQHRLVE
jgi:two-component system invasion response regulator UvrY